MIVFLTALFQFLLLVGKFVLDQYTASQDAKTAFTIDQNLFFQTCEKALTKMKFDARLDSDQAKSIEDAVDQEIAALKAAADKANNQKDPQGPSLP